MGPVKESPFCSVCGEKKTTWSQVRRHIKDIHAEPLNCPLCSKFKTTKSTLYRLRRHLKNVHRVDPEPYCTRERPKRSRCIVPETKAQVPSLLTLNIPVPAAAGSKHPSPKNSTCTRVAASASSIPVGTDSDLITAVQEVPPADERCWRKRKTNDGYHSKSPTPSSQLQDPLEIEWTPPNPKTPGTPGSTISSSSSLDSLKSPQIKIVALDNGEIQTQILGTTGNAAPQNQMSPTGKKQMVRDTHEIREPKSELAKAHTSIPEPLKENKTPYSSSHPPVAKVQSPIKEQLSIIKTPSSPSKLNVSVESLPPPVRRVASLSATRKAKRAPPFTKLSKFLPGRQPDALKTKEPKLIPLESKNASTFADPRQFFAGAPSMIKSQFPASPMRRIRKEALEQSISAGGIEVHTFPDCLSSIKKVERAVLPDGTVYELSTTWTRDPEFKVRHTKDTQTDDVSCGDNSRNP